MAWAAGPAIDDCRRGKPRGTQPAGHLTVANPQEDTGSRWRKPHFSRSSEQRSGMKKASNKSMHIRELYVSILSRKGADLDVISYS